MWIEKALSESPLKQKRGPKTLGGMRINEDASLAFQKKLAQVQYKFKEAGYVSDALPKSLLKALPEL